MEKDKKELIEMNYDIINIDITNESRKVIVNKFNLVDVIFVAGGNSFYLLQQLKLKEVLSDLIEFANEKIYKLKEEYAVLYEKYISIKQEINKR